jgi:uncharacterized membrane protein
VDNRDKTVPAFPAGADKSAAKDLTWPESKEKSNKDPVCGTADPDLLSILAAPEMIPKAEPETGNRRELNEVVHRMLILGLAFSTTVIFVGLVLCLIYNCPMPNAVSGFRDVWTGLSKGSPGSFLYSGILLLILTPILRVFGSLFEFIRKQDWRYALVTLLVLVILTIGIVVGK